MKVIFILLIIPISLFAQKEWRRWQQIDPKYVELNQNAIDKDRDGLIGGIQIMYNYFISDLDGDNCAFYPSCSSFFVKSVHETNFFQGLLMFSDRFARDLNLFKGWNDYPRAHNGKFYDPHYNYYLNSNEVFLSSSSNR